MVLFVEPPEPAPVASVAVEPEEAVRDDLMRVLRKGDFGNKVPGPDGEMVESLHFVEVLPAPGGGFDARVQFIAGDNFTANARRETLVRHAGRAMADIYRTDHQVESVTMQAYFPVVDELGHGDVAMVYEAVLVRSDALRANLDDPDWVDWQSLWAGGFTRSDF